MKSSKVEGHLVQPAAVPHHPLPGDGVVLRHRRGLPIDVDLISPTSQEERRRSIGVALIDAVCVVTMVGVDERVWWIMVEWVNSSFISVGL